VDDERDAPHHRIRNRRRCPAPGTLTQQPCIVSESLTATVSATLISMPWLPCTGTPCRLAQSLLCSPLRGIFVLASRTSKRRFHEEISRDVDRVRARCGGARRTGSRSGTGRRVGQRRTAGADL